MKNVEIRTPLQIIMDELAVRLNKAKSGFSCGNWDLYGMRNFINSVTDPAWKKVLDESPKDVQLILKALKAQEATAA